MESPVFKLLVENRYNKWNLLQEGTFEEDLNVNNRISPYEMKLFSDDMIKIDMNGKVVLVHSTTRQLKSIPGVLILQKNKTFGKYKNRFLYKCVPDDIRLPIFFIPYQIDMKNFSKSFENKYVTFDFENWDHNHPYGKLNHVIGPVDLLSNFYEYQLFCKSLNASIQAFSRTTAKALKEKSEEEYIQLTLDTYPLIQNRMNTHKIFSIDPPNSGDLDDAFGLEKKGENHFILSIYISNVLIWMETLKLWHSFSNRVATIYLPDRKRPMLPTCLSDCLCSLHEGRIRFAFTCDIEIVENKITRVEFLNTAIKVNKNYIYESNDLKKNKDYNMLFTLTQTLCKNYKYYHHIKTSHDVVAYLMIMMNYFSSKELIKNKNGIYRSVCFNKDKNLMNDVPDEIEHFMKGWFSNSSQYSLFQKEMNHEFLQLENYVHMTSPIRRLVDLLNLIQIHKNMNLLNVSKECLEFLDNWQCKLDYINVTMRAIRKVQNSCYLLDLCCKSPDLLDKQYEGYLFDKINRNDGLFQYMVYIPSLSMVSKITSRVDKLNYSKVNFQMFIFKQEDRFKKKIRLKIL